jgi:hypothetical protein
MGRSKIYDKVKLIVTAIVIMVGLLLSIVIMNEYSIPDNWIFFIISSVVYFVSLLWMTFMDKILPKIPRSKILMFQLPYFVLTTTLSALIFKNGLVAMPRSFFLYMVGIFVLLLCSFYFLNVLFNMKRH